MEEYKKINKADNKEFLLGFNVGFFVFIGVITCSLGLYHCNSSFTCFETCYPLQYKTCNNNFVQCANNEIKIKGDTKK